MTAPRVRKVCVLLLALLCFAIALSAACLTVRAAEGKESIWGEWIIDREPTETEPGMRHRVAKTTGAVEYEEIPVLVLSPAPTPTPTPESTPRPVPLPSPTPEPVPEQTAPPVLTKAEAAAVGATGGISVFFVLFCVLWVLPVRRILHTDKSEKQKRMAKAAEIRAERRRFK
ncbi:MAG: hypothetical protein LBO63_05350 [Oscillospiraceae bacterium]|jgi:hypothetical protein|nr:hypothetical protein [Oscillospiraceae bacterium]